MRPLDFLVQRAAVDGATRWRRVYQLGSKAELLAVVKQPEGGGGPITVRAAPPRARGGAGELRGITAAAHAQAAA